MNENNDATKTTQEAEKLDNLQAQLEDISKQPEVPVQTGNESNTQGPLAVDKPEVVEKLEPQTSSASPVSALGTTEQETTAKVQEQNFYGSQQEGGKSKMVFAIAVVLFVLSLLGLIAYFVGAFRQGRLGLKTPSPTASATSQATVEPTSSAEDISSWKTYTDDYMVFKFPPSWQISLSQNQLYSSSAEISLNIITTNKLTNECMQEDSTEMVGDLTVVRFSGVLDSETCSDAQLPNKREIWIEPSKASLGPGISYKYSTQNGQEAETIFENILSTFEFTKEVVSASPPASPSASHSDNGFINIIQ
jgi:Na+-transporting methylmalonyl-CoA/oxaloacetate decarboxylase gamma subunit